MISEEAEFPHGYSEIKSESQQSFDTVWDGFRWQVVNNEIGITEKEFIVNTEMM